MLGIGIKARQSESAWRAEPASPEPASLWLDEAKAPPEVSVRCISSEAEFAGLAAEWNRLHETAAVASVFNSWMWQYQWWRFYGANRPLRILVASEGGEATGILPLYAAAETALGLSVDTLKLIGIGGDTYPDDLGPLLAPGREAAASRRLAEAALGLPGADAILLADMDPRSCFPQAMEAASGRALRLVRQGRSERIVYSALPAAWPALLSALSANRRARVRSARRKLEAAHRTRFFVWDDRATLDRAVDRLVELHRKRWQAAGGSESFASRNYVEFHRSVIRSFFPRGWLRLYCLEIDGEIAAMAYCYRFRDRVFLMQAGFDPGHARWKPGSVLLGHALEHAIGEGNEVFDFLRGEHRYKNELATSERSTLYLGAFRWNPGALAYYVLPRYKRMREATLLSRTRRLLRRLAAR